MDKPKSLKVLKRDAKKIEAKLIALRKEATESQERYAQEVRSQKTLKAAEALAGRLALSAAPTDTFAGFYAEMSKKALKSDASAWDVLARTYGFPPPVFPDRKTALGQEAQPSQPSTAEARGGLDFGRSTPAALSDG